MRRSWRGRTPGHPRPGLAALDLDSPWISMPSLDLEMRGRILPLSLADSPSCQTITTLLVTARVDVVKELGAKLRKNMRRLCQWWWCHWNDILVIILDMSAVNARRQRPNTKSRGDAEMSTQDEHTTIDDRLRWQAMPKIFTTDALWTDNF
uniref:Uncharacterized protein n=1 Tax=Oryza nivara TaxID=4536 RepID=A0A0E0G7F5_ORYNI